MKLTNEMRETFVNAVMAATKIKSKWPKEAVIAEIDKRLNAAAPEEVREFDKKFPGMLSQESIRLDWLKTCEFRNNGKERWWSYGYAHGHTERSSHKENLVGRGDLGALILETDDGQRFQCGSGFDDATRAEVWAQKDKYLGQLAKVKHFEVGVKALPRFPIFLGFRDALDT